MGIAAIAVLQLLQTKSRLPSGISLKENATLRRIAKGRLMGEPLQDSAANGETTMSIATQLPTTLEDTLASPVGANPAIVACCAALERACKAALARGKDEVMARLICYSAYRSAMPPLTGPENIRDFIACTAHGMLIEAIDGPDAARLLYAAQIANGTLRHTRTSAKSVPTSPRGVDSLSVPHTEG